MNRKRIITIIILIVIPFLAFYYFKNSISNVALFFNVENLVGIIAILSGITGIAIGLASFRQASLDAVKDYFQQGDESDYTEARKYVFEMKSLDEIGYPNDIKCRDKMVAKVCNFFHFWGLMNRKRYLPIWVFEGASGIQVVKLYITLKPIIIKRRKDNQFYAIEFEKLACRIYKRYKKNFTSLKGSKWEKGLKEL